jgi:hypothetical protein
MLALKTTKEDIDKAKSYFTTIMTAQPRFYSFSLRKLLKNLFPNITFSIISHEAYLKRMNIVMVDEIDWERAIKELESCCYLELKSPDRLNSILEMLDIRIEEPKE